MFGAGRPDKQPAEDGSQGPNGAAVPDSHAVGETDETGRVGIRSRFATSQRVVVVGIAAAAVALAGSAYTLTSHSAVRTDHAQAASQPVSGPIRLESITPAAGATQVDGAGPITVTFSAPVAANTPDPTLHPAIAGNWAVEGSELVFMPATAFRPSSRVTVDVPSGLSGVRGAGGGLLAQPASEHFSTGAYSQDRLAEILGQLGYLPLTWAPTEGGAFRALTSGYDQVNVTQQAMAYDPPYGTFRWEPGYPSDLHSMWSPHQASNVIVRGAIMAFQAEHGMTTDGSVGPGLWKALFSADRQDRANNVGYTYAIASKGSPETLTIWHDGRVVLHTLANTGIPVAPTADGTFPVYERFRNQVMSGFNPDGSHYADPVSFVAYFNGGDAVHYFPRGSYGSQQSLGCVELPYTQAEEAWPYLTYGSLVTVSG